mmetsp:Transcript_157055/g.273512  ORF Transcript_157055/g.273512 Transcript_157055/m.273512 type:complete len:497 (-) Transcript_157055:48-1538(-)
MFAQAQLAQLAQSQLAQLGMGVGLPAATATPGLPVGTPAVQGGGELPTNQPIPGRIKAWYEDKGFGFISPDMGGPDVFVHRNQLSDGQALVQGSPVTFQCRLNPTRGKYEVTACSSGAAAASVGTAPAPDGVDAMALTAGYARAALPMTQDNLFIAGLPLQTNEEFIRSFFSKWGTVAQCKVLPDQPGKPDKAALVRFSDEAAAKWLVDNLHGKTPEGLTSPLTIRHAIGAPKNSGYGPAPAAGLGDSRFSPYGAAGLAPSAAAAAPAAAAAAAASSQQLTSVIAALGQLLPGLTQNPQLLQSLQGLSAQNPSLLQGGLQGLTSAAGLGGIPGLGGLPAGGAPAAAGPVDLNAQAAAAAAALTSAGVATSPAAEGATTPGFLGTSPAAMTASTATPQVAAFSPDGLAGSPAPAAALPALPAPAQQVDASATAPAAATATAGAVAAPGVTPAPAPVPAPVPAPAPAGEWLEAKDPASGRPYYYHSVTREVRWDKPAP